jgi:hypothetical protein
MGREPAADHSRLAEHKLRINDRIGLPREEVRQAFEVREPATGRRSAAVSIRRPSGGGGGCLRSEALREEVHCFFRGIHT